MFCHLSFTFSNLGHNFIRWVTQLLHTIQKKTISLRAPEYFDALVQDCSNSNALTMELLPSCTKPSTCFTLGLSKAYFLLRRASQPFQRKVISHRLPEYFLSFFDNLWHISIEVWDEYPSVQAISENVISFIAGNICLWANWESF